MLRIIVAILAVTTTQFFANFSAGQPGINYIFLVSSLFNRCFNDLRQSAYAKIWALVGFVFAGH